MKHLFFALLIVILIAVASGVTGTAQARDSRIQSGVFEFKEPVKLLDVVLQGEYLFLHHEGMMERGKPCLFVYHAKSGGFVISLHCHPVNKDRVAQMSVVLAREAAFD